jgi:hypothetical protein
MKGYVYTLEVLIATSIILVSVGFILQTPPPQPDLQTSLVKMQSFDSLEYLDNFGKLREYVLLGNSTAIKNELSSVISDVLDYRVKICSDTCIPPSDLPGNQTIISTDYYTGSFRENYLGKKVKIWIWRKF